MNSLERQAPKAMRGFLRADGRKGIRNYVVIAYLVECAHHVARRIAGPYDLEGAQRWTDDVFDVVSDALRHPNSQQLAVPMMMLTRAANGPVGFWMWATRA